MAVSEDGALQEEYQQPRAEVRQEAVYKEAEVRQGVLVEEQEAISENAAQGGVHNRVVRERYVV